MASKRGDRDRPDLGQEQGGAEDTDPGDGLEPLGVGVLGDALDVGIIPGNLGALTEATPSRPAPPRFLPRSASGHRDLAPPRAQLSS